MSDNSGNGRHMMLSEGLITGLNYFGGDMLINAYSSETGVGEVATLSGGLSGSNSVEALLYQVDYLD